MPVNFKIQKGTSKDSGHLCYSCVFSHIVNDKRCFCTRLGYEESEIKEKVVSCNIFTNKSDTSLHDMKQIAWILETSQSKVGFTHPKKWREDHKYEEVLED